VDTSCKLLKGARCIDDDEDNDATSVHG
jgi:hypothetical protein